MNTQFARMQSARTVKIALRAGAILFFVIISISLVFSLIYSPEYIFRCWSWGVLKVGEDQAETHTIKASLTPFQFQLGSAEEENQVEQVFKQVFQTTDLEAYLRATKTQALIVVQKDRVLYEHYFNGYERNSMLQSHSVTKSFISALVGIAISEGEIGSVEDPITKYIPELASRDVRFDKVTIRHLLTMSSGIRFHKYFFFTADSSLSGAYPDLRYAALHFTKIIDQPGRRFLYNDYNPQLLGILLERVTGTSVSHYLEQQIWQPLGMEYDASWVLDSKESQFEKMQGGLNARAIDLAKFGSLYLQGGVWQGRSLIPKSWVAQSTQQPTSSVEGIAEGLYYQYFWWGVPREHEDSDYYAMGNYGQMIYVSPSKNLIVVRFGEPSDSGEGISIWYNAGHEFVERFRNLPQDSKDTLINR